jgi:serine/threonine-protein kinase
VDDDLIGAILGNCAIEDLLGQGGMARVYRGRQEHLDRDVAIKVLPPYYAADPAFVERFKLEARAMAKLSHPHIVTVHDAGEDNGQLYIIMEYIGGGTLKQRMAAAMPLKDVTRVVHEVASALSYAHTVGIVHRDVKPVNVLMDASGRAVLSDFGIAKVLETSAALTHAGAGVGTPEYMSPEQCRGAPVDARADIYALGVMLYEMLTGRTPFQADNYTALAHSHIYEPVPPPSRLNPRISPAVQSVILKALEKDPANRFQKATELADALEAAVSAQTPVAPAAGRLLSSPPARPAPSSGPQRGGAVPVVYCPRCQSANGVHQHFCSSCGLAFGPTPPSGNGQHPQVTGSWVGCPQCRALNPPMNRYCTSCGAPLLARVEVRVCRVCGMRNGADKHFCTACGKSLT